MTSEQFLVFARLFPEPLFLLSLQGRVLACNPAVTTRLGRRRDELQGKLLAALVTTPSDQVARYLRDCSRTSTFFPGVLTFAPYNGHSARHYRCEGARVYTTSPDDVGSIILRLKLAEEANRNFILLNQQIEALRKEVRQRQRAEEAERTQREFFQVTLASIGDAVIITDPSGDVTFLNSRAEELTGWTTAEVKGKQLPEVLHLTHEESREPVENPVMKVLRTNAVVEVADHTILCTKHGREIPIDDSAAPIRDEQGRLLGIVLVFRDITERRRAERALRESEARLQAIVTTAVDGIITIDEHGRIEWLNPAAEWMFGYTAQELVGQNVKRLMPSPYHEEHDHYLANYRRTGAPKVIGSGREVVGRRRDGTTFPLELAVSEVHIPTRRFFTGIVRDISARKQAEEALRYSEERFRVALARSPITVFHQDTALRYTWLYNPFPGFAVAEVLGKHDKDLLPPEDAACLITVKEHALASRQRVQQEVSYRFQGATYVFDLTVEPLWDATGQLLGLTGAGIDVTARKQAEVEQERLLAEVRRVNAELQQFAYIVSHDLSEPLRTMRSFVQLLARHLQGQLSVEATEYMAFVSDAAQRMQQMLTDLLAYTRAGQVLELQAVDCEVVLAQVLAALQAQIAEGGAIITHEPLPIVQGDATRIGQVFQNLLGNALKFCDGHSPRIHLWAQQGPQHWQFAVRDNGIGIDPQQFGKLFQVFQRAHGKEYAGTGIGLAICKRIVEQHGGRIWVESRQGQGATFYFTLGDPSPSST